MYKNHIVFPSVSYCGEDAIDWIHVIFYNETQIREMINNLENLLNEKKPDAHFHVQSIENNPNLQGKINNPDLPAHIKNQEFIEIIFCGPNFYKSGWHESIKRLTYNYLHERKKLCSLERLNKCRAKKYESFLTLRKRRRYRFSIHFQQDSKVRRGFRIRGSLSKGIRRSSNPVL